jgi:ATP-dependent DNA ligase
MFITPMYAKKMPDDFDLKSDEWVAEEKIDGIRIVAERFADGNIGTWSRYAKWHPVPSQILDWIKRLPTVILDGEVAAPGKRSYGTAALINDSDCIYSVFDILEVDGQPTLKLNQVERRELLVELFKHIPADAPMQLLPSWEVNSMEDVYARRDEVWARDGEGLILKKKSVIYMPGKRPKEWLKVKKLQSAKLTITNFLPGTGSIIDTGPYAIAVLSDEELNQCRVRVPTDALREELQKAGIAINYEGPPMRYTVAGHLHPWVGKKLWIEYQERTPDGGYRHPRWDRLED